MPTHLALGSSVGLNDEELASLADWQSAACFDETDRLVLRYADDLTKNSRVDEGLWESLRARFSEKELFELCFSVGTAALINRVHATFLTDVDPRTQARVDEIERRRSSSRASE